MPLAEVQEHHKLTPWRFASFLGGRIMGCKDTLITNYSITDDGTGHIDMYLKIVDDDTILIGEYMEPSRESRRSITNAAPHGRQRRLPRRAT